VTRVLHVLDHSVPMQSGYASRSLAILREQQGAGLEVRGITGRRHTEAGPSLETVGDIDFHRTEGKRIGPPLLRHWLELRAFTRAIDRLCEAWQPDLLHAHSPAICGEAALQVARRRQIPLVYEIRAFWEDAWVENNAGTASSLRYRLSRAHETRIAERADAVVTICQGLRADLLARGLAPDKITIVPNGIDLARHGTPLPRDEALAAQLGLGAGPVLGYIGSFFAYEGLDDLIAAMPELLRQVPNAQLLVVGGGPCTEALLAQARSSSAAAAIHVVGRVPHGEVARYYALSDVMVYPRKASRLTELVTPLKPLEAMAYGTLVAASDVGGHRELMTHGTTATLFPPGDPSGCAAALAGLLADRHSWEARCDAARKHVEAHHNWVSNVERYLSTYQTVLA
jgi:glycogen(starch) synthase